MMNWHEMEGLSRLCNDEVLACQKPGGFSND